MPDPRNTHTNAADSAPGVGDGPRASGGGRVEYHPKGRRIVWYIVAAAAALLIVIAIAKPEGTSREDPTPAVAPDSATVAPR